MGHDLRKYARQTNIQLIVGFLLILFLVGAGLIFLFYGKGAAIMGAICIIGGLVPIGLIYLALLGIDWIAKNNKS